MSIEISLNQGKKYNNYQNRIKKGVEKKQQNLKKSNNRKGKEGFQNHGIFKNVFVDEAKNRIDTQQLNSQDDLTLQNLVTQYNDLMTQYETISATLSNELYNEVEKSTIKDPYRGTSIRLSNGEIGYVTEMGNYKWYDSSVIDTTLGKNGCPANTSDVADVDNVNVYNIPGQFLDTTTKLLVGQPMKAGQSCGNEGKNVYVNSMSTNEIVTFMGCYNQYQPIDNTNYIINGNFSSSSPIANDSYEFVPGNQYLLSWWFWATLVNNSSFLQVPRPYPMGNQICFLQNENYIYQVCPNVPAGIYTLSFYYCQSDFLYPEQYGPCSIYFSMNNVYWLTYNAPYPQFTWIPVVANGYNHTGGNLKVELMGINTGTGSQNGSFIQGVTLKLSDDSGNEYNTNTHAMQNANIPYQSTVTFDNCKLYAKDNGYPYFSLNNTQSDGTGTCMVSTDLNQAKQFGESLDYNGSSIWNSGAIGFRLQVNGLQLVLYGMDSHNTETAVANWPDSVPPDCAGSGMINNVVATWGSNCDSVSLGNATNGVISAIANSGNNYQTAYTVGTGMGTVTYPATYSYNQVGQPDQICSGGPAYVAVPGYPYWTQQTQADCETTCTNDPNCVAYDMVINGQNNGTNQCAFFTAGNNVTPMGQGNNLLGCYDKIEQTNSGTDPAPRCAKDFDISYQCGNTPKTGHIPGEASGQNFVLDCSAEEAACACFLIVQDDGNVVLYKGTPVSGGDQGGLWSTGTQNVVRQPNPAWVATKGKYGRNYLNVGEYLNMGEWVGSNDGSMRLIMQEDGYVSLVINNTTGDCVSIEGGYGGGPKSNAIYQLNPVGNKSLIGRVGYVDEDSVLREYPSSMIGKSTNYDVLQGYNSWGNDLPGMPLTNYSVDNCKIACNDNAECNGFAYDNKLNNCYLKNSNMFPGGSWVDNDSGTNLWDANSDLYLRIPEIFGVPSCSKQMSPVDSIQYSKYIKGNNMTTTSTCGFVIDTQQLIDIENQLAALADQISAQINVLEANNIDLNQQMIKDHILTKKDLLKYKKIKAQIGSVLDKYPSPSASTVEQVFTNKNLTSNYSMKEGMLGMNDLDSMVTDSDLNVLKNNYQYIFWTILAIGAIIITINTIKN